MIEVFNSIVQKEAPTRSMRTSTTQFLTEPKKRNSIKLDDKRKISTPFKTIDYKNMQYLLDQLTNIIYENNVSGIIIGYPINMDGSLGRAAQSVTDKANIISKNLKIDVVLWDERMSTKGAFNISKELDVNVTKREKKIDENAASFILQGAIDYLNN